MNKERFIVKLNEIGACQAAVKWVKSCKGQTDQECWDLCQNPRWMFWLIGKYPFNQKTLVKAACKIARLTLKCVPAGESRPLAAIEAAEGWANDNGTTLEQVRTAAAAADAAADAAYAAADAAYAAAAYATADATADAAYAAYAAHATYAESCKIIREYFPDVSKIGKE